MSDRKTITDITLAASECARSRGRHSAYNFLRAIIGGTVYDNTALRQWCLDHLNDERALELQERSEAALYDGERDAMVKAPIVESDVDAMFATMAQRLAKFCAQQTSIGLLESGLPCGCDRYDTAHAIGDDGKWTCILSHLRWDDRSERAHYERMDYLAHQCTDGGWRSVKKGETCGLCGKPPRVMCRDYGPPMAKPSMPGHTTRLYLGDDPAEVAAPPPTHSWKHACPSRGGVHVTVFDATRCASCHAHLDRLTGKVTW